MNINDTTELINTLLSQTDKKAEKKVYTCFIRTLSAIKERDLTENQLQLIQEKLSSLNLKTTPENRIKYYKQKHIEFNSFLKHKFSITPMGYYREKGIVYGMFFGVAIGAGFGNVMNIITETSIGLSAGISIGIITGMLLGMLYGKRKDYNATLQGSVY